MLPWKSFVRSVSVVTLLTAGAFAAGSDVTPFSHASRSTSPNVVVDEEPPAVEEEDAPVVDPADEVADDTTTTTTTAPEATDPDADANADDDPIVPEVVDVPEVITTTTAPPAAIEVDKKSAPRVIAVPDVSREKPKKQKGDHNCDGHLDNGWHNKSAEWRAGHPGGCPSPASVPAPVVAEQQDARAPKGDHNGDGHCDNGRHKTSPSTCDPDAVRGDRPETAPGKVRKSR